MTKRLLDLGLVILTMPIWLPLVALTALVVRVGIGRPVLFVQHRPGLHGALFPLVKFRTMSDARDASGALLPDDRRLSAIGRTLRELSLDELPEIWNVIRGHMSLVGPRPLLVDYLELYSSRQARRHEVLPGITGWAQIHGRNLLSWEQRFDLDVWYVDHRSTWLDLKILALTIFQVLRQHGISAKGEATMQRFRGTPS